MALRFQIEDAAKLDDRVWKARLSPSEVKLLDPKSEGSGDVTVLLLFDEPSFDSSRRLLAFDPSQARVLNIGSSDQAVLVASPADAKRRQSKANVAAPSGSGDAKFISSLPPQLEQLGKAILDSIRRKYPGDLTYYGASGKYVEAPDNFWTIRPQPRDKSFRITVRGRPGSFKAPRTLELKPDMSSYSSLKVERPGQIEELLQVLAQVSRK